MLDRYLLIIGLAATTALGCGEAFTSGGTAGAGGASSSTATGSGGEPGTTAGSGGGGLSDDACQAGVLNNVNSLRLFTTLDSDEAIRMPLHPSDGIGNVAGIEIVQALNGNGAKLAGEGQQFYYLNAPQYFNAPEGTVDFCFMPNVGSEEPRPRSFFTVRNAVYEWASLRYTKDDDLEFRLGGPSSSSDDSIMVGTVIDPPIEQGRWYRLTVAWSFNNNLISMYLDGQALTVEVFKEPLMLQALAGTARLVVGDVVNGDGKDLSTDAVLDELHIYGAFTTP